MGHTSGFCGNSGTYGAYALQFRTKLSVRASGAEIRGLTCGQEHAQRLELTPESASRASRYKKIVARPKGGWTNLLVALFLEAHIILDVDATDHPLHGNQEKRSFQGTTGVLLFALHIFLRRAPTLLQGCAPLISILPRRDVTHQWRMLTLDSGLEQAYRCKARINVRVRNLMSTIRNAAADTLRKLPPAQWSVAPYLLTQIKNAMAALELSLHVAGVPRRGLAALAKAGACDGRARSRTAFENTFLLFAHSTWKAVIRWRSAHGTDSAAHQQSLLTGRPSYQ